MTKKRNSDANTQRGRILAALRCHPHTSYELRKLGCYQANTRVLELRRMGYDIRTKRVSILDDDGYRHDGIALYVLYESGDVLPPPDGFRYIHLGVATQWKT